MEGKTETKKVIENFTIFHFSDTHFGADISADKKSWLEKFLADLLQKALDKIGLAIHDSSIYKILLDEFGKRTREVEHSCGFIHSGDVSAFGSRENLRIGNRLLENIRHLFIGVLNEPQNALFIIPGNHDIININEKVDFPFNTDDFDLEFYGNTGTNLYPRKYEPEIPGNPITIIGLNSISIDGTKNIKGAKGIGRIDKSQLQDADRFLAAKKSPSQKKIVVLHHSPLNFPQFPKRKGLYLEKAPEFIGWLYSNRIDLVLCGHLHRDFHVYEKLELLMKKYNKVTSTKDINKTVLRIIKKREDLSVPDKLVMGGKLVGELERFAFAFVVKRRVNVALEKRVKKSLKRFYQKLKEFPEYLEFMNMVEGIKSEKMRVIVAGTACQTDSKPRYNYWEIKMKLQHKEHEIFNNLLDERTNRFFRKPDRGVSSN